MRVVEVTPLTSASTPSVHRVHRPFGPTRRESGAFSPGVGADRSVPSVGTLFRVSGQCPRTSSLYPHGAPNPNSHNPLVAPGDPPDVPRPHTILPEVRHTYLRPPLRPPMYLVRHARVGTGPDPGRARETTGSTTTRDLLRSPIWSDLIPEVPGLETHSSLTRSQSRLVSSLPGDTGPLRRLYGRRPLGPSTLLYANVFERTLTSDLAGRTGGPPRTGDVLRDDKRPDPGKRRRRQHTPRQLSRRLTRSDTLSDVDTRPSKYRLRKGDTVLYSVVPEQYYFV